jgi:GT2 family glycosyltransferase/glycosyltransferase involved in cell wall biosynthesis
LETLFSDISRTLDEGRIEAALRFADRARRLAPEDTTCLLVYGRLLTRIGAPSQAAHLLRGRQDPDGSLAYAEALYAQGSLDGAISSCGTLLSRFAVDFVENLSQFAARLCRTQPVPFSGWVGVDSALRLVGQVRTGSHLTIQYGDRALHPAVSAIVEDGFHSFSCAVPVAGSGRLTVCAAESKLLGSGIAWPPEFGLSGWVLAENEQLVGRAQLDWAPALPLALAVARSDDGHSRRVILTSVKQPAGSLFSISLQSDERAGSKLDVFAVLPDGSYAPLAGSPVAIKPLPPASVEARPRPTIRAGCAAADSKTMIDIVIPVFRGYEETLACFESVRQTTTRNEAELVVVNDASPDAELCDALAHLAEDGRITLLTNQSNQGFPAAANRGMNLHPDRDVVLLNSDTELFGDWLARLKFAAYYEDDIGTVTPLGEAASIASYRGNLAGEHTRAEAAEIDRIAREVNARKAVELPVGVGYCLYIKRACIAEAGGFDEDSFGRGYGEENDFCLRTRGMGWRHVAATDLFVRHRGARSYERMKEILTERNGRALNALYPGYDAMIADFVAADPLLAARRSIDMHRLLKQATDPVLLVTFGLPGGVKRHVDARRSELAAMGHNVLTLQPSEAPNRTNQVILSHPALGLENLAFNLPEELPLLRALLLELQLSEVELHHFVGFPSAVLSLVTSLGVGYDVYVHDYSWVCPRMNMAGGDGAYCGEPVIEECERCICAHGTALEKSLTVEALRLRSSRILNGARAVIVPAEDVRTRLARYFCGLPMKVMAWEKPFEPVYRPAVVPGRVRVAVIGGISVPKGCQILLECARDAAERNLDLEFVVIGFTCDDDPLLATGRVFITGPYAEEEVSTLLERERCHAGFFPSVIPETWCYALSHALARGLPIIAFDLGAIAERLRSYVGADLLSLHTPVGTINDALLRSARRVTKSNSQKERAMDPTPTNDSPNEELSASVQILTLPTGTYTFMVKGGGTTDTSAVGLALPALQVGLAPMSSAGEVGFVAREGTTDRWLARGGDLIVAKIYSDEASLMLTSVRLPNSPALAIDIRRLGDEPFPEYAEAATGETEGDVFTQIVAHIQNLGDIPFTDGLAGCIGRLWIEAFAIRAAGQLSADSFEYYGVSADGFQTPWVGNEVLCGSRGRGVPMLAYAIRLKPEIADQYECTYTGKFMSGSILGPFKNGDLCCSEVPRDPLWGIELRITPRRVPEAEKPSPEIEHSNVA